MALNNNLRSSTTPSLIGINQLINRLFDPSLLTGGATSTSFPNLLTTNWIPTVDIKNEANQFTIHADVPGVETKDIEVSVEAGNTLIIKGRKETSTERRTNNFLRVERTSWLILS